MLGQARIIEEGRAVALEFPDGSERRFHAVWLRDEATRSPGNGQRLITIGDIPAGTRIAAAQTAGSQLRVTFEPEGRTITYDAAWLADHAHDRARPRAPGWTAPAIETWDAGFGEPATLIERC